MLKDLLFYYLVVFFITWCAFIIWLTYNMGSLGIMIGLGTIGASAGITCILQILKNIRR